MPATAPIALFVYNRPSHTRQVLESLMANNGAADSSLYIFADGAKHGASGLVLDNISQVRSVIREKQWCGKVEIIESESNKGLANSIISGTTKLINDYGRAIILEDDLVLHKNFLEYMNAALERYKDDPKVFSVTGYQFPIKFPDNVTSTFFFDDISSWSWGTWKRAWDQFDPVAKGWEKMKTDLELRRRFNFDNASDYYGMLVRQMETKEIDSWAVRWYWSVFKQGGLNLYPKYSLVQNIGFDGSGMHGADNNSNFSGLYAGVFQPEFPLKAEANAVARKVIVHFWKMQNDHSLVTRIRRRLGKMFN